MIIQNIAVMKGNHLNIPPNMEVYFKMQSLQISEKGNHDLLSCKHENKALKLVGQRC